MGQCLGTLFVQELLQSGLRIAGALGESGDIKLFALRVGIGNLNIGNVLENTGGTVLGINNIKQLRRLVYEFGVAFACLEGRMAQKQVILTIRES